MHKDAPFNGFEDLIRIPLEDSDSKSFLRITRLFIEDTASRNAPFTFLINKISGLSFSEPAAVSHWKQILKNKVDMESKLGRRISIDTAAVDYFDRQSNPVESGHKQGNHSIIPEREEWLNRIYAPSYYMEKLKEEVLRAKRYKHSLSVILLDVDDFSRINELYSFTTGDEILAVIVKIIQKTIRTVDIISRFSGDVFLIILPNTNKREAGELAERIRSNIEKRTKRISNLAEGVTATLAAGQCDKSESASFFLARIQSLLESGKPKRRNAVYSG
jgi:diguanylate cyclase (GGDEF)-like protein